MARPDRPAVDGWVNLDKPVGPTSTQALGRVRRLFAGTKAGHAGTLDPLASGVLPIAFGEATKTLAFMVDAAKRYEFDVAWGRSTSTDDLEGETVATSPVRPAPSAVAAALDGFLGRRPQRPPSHSAIKIGGARAYDLARAGRPPELAPREVDIYALTLLAADESGATLALHCGKGTYVRALARDLSLALGTVGHVTRLRRTAVGPFRAEEAISLDSLGEISDQARLAERLLPVLTALDDIPALAVTADEADCFRSGRMVAIDRASPGLGACVRHPGRVLAVVLDGLPVALVRADAEGVRPVRGFNLSR
jgi:tRNA pseudouridine55 synthase